MNNFTDNDILESFQNGDKKSFEKIVNKYEKKVFHICYAFFKNHEEALDTSQEIFIKVYRNLDKFKGDSKLYTWIYKISVNTCKSRIKIWQKRYWQEAFSIDKSFEDEKGRTSYQFSDNSGNPEDIIASREDLKALADIIKQLPVKYKLPLLLRDIHGLSYEEICSITDLNIGTLKSRIFRAREIISSKCKIG
jgi:RNA polymerase sigma-70 factor (ECF subfamily)